MRLTDLHIGEIRFRVGGLDEDSARELAQLVAVGLSAAAAINGPPARIDRLTVAVASEPSDDAASLACRVIDHVRAEMDRLGGGGGPAS